MRIYIIVSLKMFKATIFANWLALSVEWLKNTIGDFSVEE